MRKAVQRLKNERGLTLVELLAVIVILAIVAVIAFVFIGGIIENSKKDAHIANAQQAIAAAKLHEASGGKFGEGQNEGKIQISELQTMDYLESKLVNPWGGEYSPTNTDIVEKEGEVYKVTFKVDECQLENEYEADLSTNDRKTICEG